MCVSILALFILRAKSMHCIVFSSVACLVLQYFVHISHKGYDFWKTLIKHKNVYFDSLCNFV